MCCWGSVVVLDPSWEGASGPSKVLGATAQQTPYAGLTMEMSGT